MDSTEKDPKAGKLGEKNLNRSSPITKFTIRQSVDSAEPRYEININAIQPDNRKIFREESSENLGRIPFPESENSETINNGLAPMEIDLISGTMEMEEEDEDDEEVEEEVEEEVILEHINELDTQQKNPLELELSLEPPIVVSKQEEDSVTLISTPKMTREMKNLQKSTNDSKVLTDYLNTSDSPRNSRSRKVKETNAPTSESELLLINTDTSASLEIGDKVIELKGSPDDENDSDSTVVVNDDVGKKRRKSFSRSRTASRAKSVSASRGRPKSVSRMLNEEMAASSEREDHNDEVDDADVDMGELHSITKPIENRAPNPPPKVIINNN